MQKPAMVSKAEATISPGTSGGVIIPKHTFEEAMVPGRVSGEVIVLGEGSAEVMVLEEGSGEVIEVADASRWLRKRFCVLPKSRYKL